MHCASPNPFQIHAMWCNSLVRKRVYYDFFMSIVMIVKYPRRVSESIFLKPRCPTGFCRKREGNTRWDKEEGGEFGELGGKRNGLHLVNGLHSHSPFIHRAAQFASHSAIFTDVAHQWQLSNCPEINMSFSWSLTSNLGIPLMVRKHVWTCVRLCLCTRGIKSGAGPYWCGTKCHSLIRMNSPVWLWDRAPTHSRASMCVRWLIAFTLSLLRTRSRPLGRTGFTFLWPTRRVCGQMC